MSNIDERIIAEAAAWHAASVHDDMDWDSFTSWLEAAPLHGAAYDEVARTDALLSEHVDCLRPEATPALSRPPRRISKLWVSVGMAIAASLVAMLTLPYLLSPPPQSYQTVNNSREIALNDGSTILLAPHSRLTVEGRGQNSLALSGGAWFAIRHDPARSLSIRAGDVEIGDIGTSFDVQSEAGRTRIAVAEGQVSVTAKALAQAIQLSKGRGLIYDGHEGTATLSIIDSDKIGAWRTGQLTYDSAPLSLVAADLSRYANVQINMPAAFSNRRFSGTLVIRDGKEAVRDLSQLMGIAYLSDAGGYSLSEHR